MRRGKNTRHGKRLSAGELLRNLMLFNFSEERDEELVSNTLIEVWKT